MYRLHLASGVHVEIDLLAADRWRSVTHPPPDDASRALLRVLVDDADDVRGRCAVQTTSTAAAAAGSAPWLRIAAVDAVDRWLQAPLEQWLVDAERGVARGRALRALPPGPARAVVTGDAVRFTRRSSQGVVAFLRRLGRHPLPIPRGLCSVVENLVDGFAELVETVGPERELVSVLDGWRRLSRRLTAEKSAAASPSSDPVPQRVKRLSRAESMIDPRQVRARVLALSSDPASPEVEVSMTDRPDGVVVRVPAFGRVVDPDTALRLLVRLVDRRTGEAHGHALLRASRTGYFEATVPLYGLDVADVRVDVADALSDLPPASDNADEGLCEARRAVVFLAEWRRLVGLAQLGVATAAPALRLRDLATRLQPGRSHSELQLFTNGPSSAELTALADLGDDELTRRLRGEGPIAEGLRALTAGPAALLVAELAALVVPPAP